MSRFSNHQRRQYAHHDEANIQRAIPHEDNTKYTNTPAGDTRKLRGIPAIGKGVRGAIPGSVPGDIR